MTEPEHAPVLRADFDRLMLVLRNLVDNALKYTVNGFVLVQASLSPATQPQSSSQLSSSSQSKAKRADEELVADADHEFDCILQLICRDTGDSSQFPRSAMSSV